MNSYELDQRMNELLGVMSDWIQDERKNYIDMNIEEIERKASQLEITCDYYIAEFV